MLPLSTASMIEKNQISATGVWLMLLDITHNNETVRLVNNTENIQFKGNTTQPSRSNLADVNKTKRIYQMLNYPCLM